MLVIEDPSLQLSDKENKIATLFHILLVVFLEKLTQTFH